MSPRRKREPAAGGGVPGSTEAKRLAAGVLEVLSGLRGPQETSKLLGISLTRYYQLERRSLAGLIAALERRPKGRRRSAEDELSALRRDKQRLEQELGRVQALLRAAQRSMGLPAARRDKAGEGTVKRRRTRRTTVRVQHALELLRQEAPPDAASVGTASEAKEA